MIKFNNKSILVCFGFALLFFFSFWGNPIVFAEDEDNQEVLFEDEIISIDYKNNELYLSDSTNKKIIINNLKDNSVKEIPTNKSPHLVFTDYQNNLYYIEDGTLGLYENKTHLYNKIENNDILNILDICCDTSNNIYVICNNAESTPLPLVLIKKNDSDIFEVFCKLDNSLSLDLNSKLTSSFENGFLILYTNNNFYKITENNFSLLSAQDYNLPTITNVLDIKLDFYDNLYILGDNKLFRCNKTSCHELENLNSALEFELDYLTGDIILRTNTNVTKLKNTDFVVKMSSSTPDYHNTKYACSIIKTTEKTYLYEFDNSLYKKEINNKAVEIEKDTNLVSLIKTDNDFYYVLINNLSNENITGYIKASSAEIINQDETEKDIRIINTTTPLYLYPTSLDESLILKNNANKIIYLNKTKLYKITIEDFGTTDTNGVSFAKISYENQDYYINTNNFVIADKTTIQPITEQLSEETIVYSDQSLNNSQATLPKGTNINILETGENYAKISYGTEIGYIKYKMAEEIHITVWQLLAIILLTIIAVVGVILSIVAILKHKQQKM